MKTKNILSIAHRNTHEQALKVAAMQPLTTLQLLRAALSAALQAGDGTAEFLTRLHEHEIDLLRSR